MALPDLRHQERDAGSHHSIESLGLHISPETSHKLSRLADSHSEKPRVLVSDVDEVIFLSTQRHYELWNRKFRDHLREEVSYEQFCQLGGTYGVYANPHYLPEDRIALFKKVQPYVVKAPKFNRGLPLVDPEIRTTLQNIESISPLAFYLSTRPEEIAELTHQEITLQSLPDVPVFARPSTTDISLTNQWKAAILQEFARYYPGDIYLLDDSASQYEYIAQLDQTDPRNQRIRPLLFAGKRTPARYLEKYPSVHWQTLSQVMEQEAKIIRLR